MCWSSKPHVPPPSADRLALPVTKSPPMLAANTTYNTTFLVTEEPAGNGELEFTCNPPSERCDVTSSYSSYCEHGICCQLSGEEFCACYDPIYTGDRCDIHELELVLGERLYEVCRCPTLQVRHVRA